MKFMEKFNGEFHQCYMTTRTASEVNELSQEAQIMIAFCQELKWWPRAEHVAHYLAAEEAVISKKYQQRILHIVFYLHYANFLALTDSPNEMKLKALITCEYYSRDLALLSCALHCCMELQRDYCDRKMFELSKKYARKVIKLSILMKDRNGEEEGIQAMKLLCYYTGMLQVDAKWEVT